MQVRSTIVAAFMSCILCVVGLPVGAANGSATATLLKLLGYDAFVESFAIALGESNKQLELGDDRLALAWELAARETFPSDKMLEEIVSAVAVGLDADHVKAATVFLSSELGMLVTRMEVEAQRPDQSDRVDAEGAAILADLIERDAPRLDAYTRVIEALGAIDSQLAAAMNLNYAIYAGMFQSGSLPYHLSEGEILELVTSQQDMLRSHIHDKIYTMFAYTYRDLSDAELSQYIDFLTSKAGSAVYGAIQLATQEVLSKRARRFGNRLMELQNVQEL